MQTKAEGTVDSFTSTKQGWTIPHCHLRLAQSLACGGRTGKGKASFPGLIAFSHLNYQSTELI